MRVPQSVDANASAPVLPQAWAAYAEAAADYADPAAPHPAGRAARRRLEDARAAVAAFLHAEPDEIHFTSGGTEADAWAVGSVLGLAPGSHCVTSSIEHAAVARALDALAQTAPGFLGPQGPSSSGSKVSEPYARVTRVPVDRTGRVSAAAMGQAMQGSTRLVTLLAASNETGVIQPVADVAAYARAAGAHMHTDAVQAVGRMPVDVRAWGVDSLALAGHKLGAVGGIGALFVRRGIALRLLYPREAVDANVAGAVSLAAALAHQPTAAQLQEMGLRRDAFEAGVLSELSDIEILGADADRLPNTSCIRLQGCAADGVLMALDLQGFAVSTGSACSSGSIEPSPILLGMGLSAREARETVRFSLPMGFDAAELVPQVVRVVLAMRGRAA